MMVEVKNGSHFEGRMEKADGFMNMKLISVTCTSNDGESFWTMKECFIRGNNIKNVIMGPAVLEKTEAERTQYNIMMRGKKRGFRGRGGGSMRGEDKSPQMYPTEYLFKPMGVAQNLKHPAMPPQGAWGNYHTPGYLDELMRGGTAPTKIREYPIQPQPPKVNNMTGGGRMQHIHPIYGGQNRTTSDFFNPGSIVVKQYNLPEDRKKPIKVKSGEGRGRRKMNKSKKEKNNLNIKEIDDKPMGVLGSMGDGPNICLSGGQPTPVIPVIPHSPHSNEIARRINKKEGKKENKKDIGGTNIISHSAVPNFIPKKPATASTSTDYYTASIIPSSSLFGSGRGERGTKRGEAFGIQTNNLFPKPREKEEEYVIENLSYSEENMADKSGSNRSDSPPLPIRPPKKNKKRRGNNIQGNNNIEGLNEGSDEDNSGIKFILNQHVPNNGRYHSVKAPSAASRSIGDVSAHNILRGGGVGIPPSTNINDKGNIDDFLELFDNSCEDLPKNKDKSTTIRHPFEDYKDFSDVNLSQRPPCRKKDPTTTVNSIGGEIFPVKKNAFMFPVSKEKIERKPINSQLYSILRPPSRHKTPPKAIGLDLPSHPHPPPDRTGNLFVGNLSERDPNRLSKTLQISGKGQKRGEISYTYLFGGGSTSSSESSLNSSIEGIYPVEEGSTTHSSSKTKANIVNHHPPLGSSTTTNQTTSKSMVNNLTGEGELGSFSREKDKSVVVEKIEVGINQFYQSEAITYNNNSPNVGQTEHPSTLAARRKLSSNFQALPEKCASATSSKRKLNIEKLQMNKRSNLALNPKSAWELPNPNQKGTNVAQYHVINNHKKPDTAVSGTGVNLNMNLGNNRKVCWENNRVSTDYDGDLFSTCINAGGMNNNSNNNQIEDSIYDRSKKFAQKNSLMAVENKSLYSIAGKVNKLAPSKKINENRAQLVTRENKRNGQLIRKHPMSAKVRSTTMTFKNKTVVPNLPFESSLGADFLNLFAHDQPRQQ